MLDSASQWNLLADCAKDWGFHADAVEAEQKETAKPQFSLQDMADTFAEDDSMENYTPLTHLVHFANLNEQEEKALLYEIMRNPKNSTLWQLCLMGYSKENFAKFSESLQNPLEGVEAWLLEGIKKGWLRKIEKEYNLTLLEYPLFIHRLQGECQCADVFTLGLVKIQASDLVHDLILQSFAKYLTLDDYISKINGLGYVVVLAGRKNFSASAVMEKISDDLEQKLHKEHIDLDFNVGLTEFCPMDTAENLLDHAKQALSLPSPTGIKVKSFINQAKKHENNSFVHSNEKRFLFFGVQ